MSQHHLGYSDENPVEAKFDVRNTDVMDINPPIASHCCILNIYSLWVPRLYVSTSLNHWCPCLSLIFPLIANMEDRYTIRCLQTATKWTLTLLNPVIVTNAIQKITSTDILFQLHHWVVDRNMSVHDSKQTSICSAVLWQNSKSGTTLIRHPL